MTAGPCILHIGFIMIMINVHAKLLKGVVISPSWRTCLRITDALRRVPRDKNAIPLRSPRYAPTQMTNPYTRILCKTLAPDVTRGASHQHRTGEETRLSRMAASLVSLHITSHAERLPTAGVRTLKRFLARVRMAVDLQTRGPTESFVASCANVAILRGRVRGL